MWLPFQPDAAGGDAFMVGVPSDTAACFGVTVYPQYDGPGQITVPLVATLCWECLTLLAWLRGGGAPGRGRCRKGPRA